ncbi:autotransporter-associated beta strand repeat-containing protein [Oleiharenicola lentus]|uniref:autotransporter-associated beta strand repeat-containing protein n=1 Tax=Oleiharenicola lentus TaxID=2508720 RepID=UPI003F6714F5
MAFPALHLKTTSLFLLPPRIRSLAVARLSWLTLAAGLFSAPALAQNTILFNTRYTAQNISMGSTSAPMNINYDQFLGLQWNERSATVGGFSYGVFGERYGLAFSAGTSGKVGFDVMFKSTSGTLDIDMPNTISFTMPDLTGTNPSGSIVVKQNRDFSTVENVIATKFPQAQFNVGAQFHVNADVTGEIAYGVGSASGTVTLTDLYQFTTLVTTMNPLLASVDPFNQDLPIISYNVNNSGKINLLGGLFGIAEKNLNQSFTFPLDTGTFTNLPKVSKALPTAVEFGSIQFKNIQLDGASGTSFTSVEQQDLVLGIRANLIGLSMLANGMPFNPLELKVKIPGTPLQVDATLLDISAGIDIGLKQTITLQPQTRIVLTSNMPVTYNVNGQIYTTMSLDILLPDNGNDLSFSIVSKPDDPKLQIFPSVYVSPIVKNNVELGLAPSIRVTALSLGISAYGFGGGIGPVYSEEFHPDPYFLSVYTSTFNIGELAQFSRRYRTADSIVNNGVALGEDLAIGLSEYVRLVNRNQPYQTSIIPVNAALEVDSGVFKNTVDLTLAAGAQLILNGDSASQTHALYMDANAQVLISSQSKFTVLGKVNVNGVPILDGNGNKQLGFIDADGTIAHGDFQIAGQFFYQGPNIKKIGTTARLALIDNDDVGNGANANLLHIVNGTTDALGPNPLTALETLDGTLILDGANLTTANPLSLGGLLDLRSGSVVTTRGLTATGTGQNVGTVFLDHGTLLDISSGTWGNLNNGTSEFANDGVLNNINLVLGDAAGGGQVRYTGDFIRQNNAVIVMAGTAPTGGFLSRSTSGNWTDGLQTLASNTNTLSLLSGAKLTSSANLFTNSGMLMISGAGSRLTTNNFTNTATGIVAVSAGRLETTGFSNVGRFTLGDGGVLKLTSIEELDLGSLHNGGEWIIGGTVDTSGSLFSITGVHRGTTLTMRTPFASFGIGALNSLSAFSYNDGNFNILAGATVQSGQLLTNAFPGVLTVAGQYDASGNTRSTFKFNGVSLFMLGTVNIGTYGIFDSTGGGLRPDTDSSLPVNLDTGEFGSVFAGVNNGVPFSVGGTWNVGGDLRYTGKIITGITAPTILTFKPSVAAPSVVSADYDTNSAGKYFQRLTGSGFVDGLTQLGSIAGTVTLEGHTSLRTDVSFNLLAGGTLNINDGASFHVTGPTLTLADGSHFNLEGNLILGNGTGTTTFRAPTNFAFTNTNGEVQLGHVMTAGTGVNARFYTSGTGIIEPFNVGGTWTNTNTLIRGSGVVRGANILNRGAIYASGETLTLDATDGFFTNSGVIGAALGIDLNNLQGTNPSTLSISNATITNHETVNGQLAQGLIDIQASGVLTNVTVNGGNVFVGSLGGLRLNSSTLNLNALKPDGSNVTGALANYGIVTLSGQNTILGNITFGKTGSMTISAGATLTTIDPLVNSGMINMNGGTLAGGMLINDGYLNVTGNSSIGRIENRESGNVTIFDGFALTLPTGMSTFTNKGYVHLAPENPATLQNSTASLILNENTTFTGGGAIQLGGYNTANFEITGENFDQTTSLWANSGAGTILAAAHRPNTTLTNLGHTIQGAGSIGGPNATLTIINGVGGLIHAMGNGRTLSIDTGVGTGGFRNIGRLDVDAGATFIVNGDFRSFGDGYDANGNWIDDGNPNNNFIFEGDYRIAGTLQLPFVASFDNSVSFLFDGPNAIIKDANNHAISIRNNLATGSLTVSGGFNYQTDTDITGQFLNYGSVTVGNNSAFTLLGNGGLNNFYRPGFHTDSEEHEVPNTFADGVTVVTKNTLDEGAWSILNGTLKFTGADIVVNATKLTLGGTNARIVNEADVNALANFSTNRADGELVILPVGTDRDYTLPTSAGAFANFGKITSNGANFTLGASDGINKFTNELGATLLADNGGTFRVQSTSLFTNNGAITAQNNSSLILGAPTFVNNSTISLVNAATPFFGNSSLSISGTNVTNLGTLTVPTGASLSINATDTLTNHGLLELRGNGVITAGTFVNTTPLTFGNGPATVYTLNLSAFDNRAPLSVGYNTTVAITAALNTFTGRSAANDLYLISVANTGMLHLRSPNITGITGTSTAASDGGIYQIAGNLRLDNPLTHLGASLTLLGPAARVTLPNGANALTLTTITASGVFGVDTLSGQGTDVAIPLTTNHGVLNVGSHLTLTSNSLSGSGTINFSGGLLTLDRSTVGTFTIDTRISGSGQINLGANTSGITVAPTGALAVTSGAFNITSPFTSNGRVEIAAGASLYFSQTPTLLGTVDIAGRLSFNTGGLTSILPAGVALNVHGATARFDNLTSLTANYGSITIGDHAEVTVGDLYHDFTNVGSFTIDTTATVHGRRMVNTGTFVINNGGTLDTFDFVNQAGGSIRINGTTNANIHGAGDLHIFGGVSTLGGTGSTYAGRTIIESGATLSIQTDSVLGRSPGLNGVPADQLRIESGATLNVASFAELAEWRNVYYSHGATITGTGSILGAITGTGLLNIGNTDGTTDALSARLVNNGQVNILGALQLLSGSNISGVINGAETARLVVSGNSSAIVSGANGFAGTVEARDGGALTIGAGGASGSFYNAALHLDGGYIIFNRVGPVILGREITGSSGDLFLRGGVQGITSSAGNNFLGTTTIDADSSLTIQQGTFGSMIVNGGLTLATTANNPITVGAISGTGSFLTSGTGQLNFSSLPTIANLGIGAGQTMQVGTGGALSALSFTPAVANNGTLAFAHSGDLSATGIISGSGGVTVRGPGRLILTAENTYAGGTTVTGGTLRLIADSALGAVPVTFDADNLILDGGALSTDLITSLASTRGLTIGSQGGTITSSNFSINTPIGGTGTLTATGELHLGLDTSTSAAGLRASTGRIFLDNANSHSSVGALFTDVSGIIEVTGAGVTTSTGQSELAGSLRIASGSMLSFAGTNTGFLKDDGHLIIRGSSALGQIDGSGSLTVNAITTGTALRLGTETLQQVPVIPGNVTVNSGASLTLSSTYVATGTTTLNTGFLGMDYGRTGALAISGASIIATSSSPGKAFSVNGPLSGSGSLSVYGDVSGGGMLQLGNIGATNVGVAINGNGTLRTVNTEAIVLGGSNQGVNGSLSVTGTAPVSVTGNNYFLNTTVGFGATLQLGHSGTTGNLNSAIYVLNNGFLSVNRSDDIYLMGGEFGIPSGVIPFGGSFTGPGGLSQDGTGKLILNTAMTYTGQTRITTGTLQIGDGGTTGSLARAIPQDLANGIPGTPVGDIINQAQLVFNRTGTLALDNAITGSGTVTQSGGSTTTLFGANNFGTLNVNAGTVVLANTNTIAQTNVANNGALTISTGSLTGAVANSGTISLERAGDYVNTFTTTGSGLVVQNGGGTAYLNGTTQSNRLTVNSGYLATIVANNETTSLNGQLTVAADTSFIKYGGGTLVLNAGASGAGVLDATSGTTRLAGGNFTSDIHVGATLEIVQDMGFTKTISGSHGTVSLVDSELALLGTINVGTTRIDATSKLGLNNGSSLSGSVVNNGLISFDYSFGNDTTFASAVNGTGAFAQNGAGKVTLTGINTATGGATIAANRTLAIAGNGSLSGPVTNHGTLSLADSGSINGAVTNHGTFAVITTAGSRTNLLGNITGSGTLAFSGAGTVGVGNLASAATLSDGVTLLTGGSGTSTFSKFVSGTGNLSVEGTGTLIITGDTLLNGDVTLTLGTLQIGDGGATGSVSANHFFNNGTLVYNLGSGATATLGAVSGNGAIRQSGAGTLSILSDHPNFTGTTTVDATRTLWIGNGTTGSIGGALVVDGTLNYNRTGVLVNPVVPSSGYVVTLANSITGAATGRFELLSGEHLTLNGGINFLGEIVTAGTLTVNGNLNNSLDRLSARTLVNHSSLTLTGDSSGGLLNSSVTNDGTLTFGTGGTSGWLGNVSIANSGTVAINRSDDVTFGNGANLGGNGVITQNGTGRTTIYSSVFADRLEANAGTLEFYNGVAKSGGGSAQIKIAATGTALLHTGSYANQITNDGTLQTLGNVELTASGNAYNGALSIGSGSLTVNVNETQALAGALTGSGDLRSYGNGALQLANAGTFTGAIATRGSSISSASDLRSNVTFEYGGLLEFTNAGNTTFSGTLAASYAGFASALRYTGLGSFTLDSAYAGATEITRGQLLLGTNGSLGGALTLGNYSGASFVLSGKNATLSSLSGGGVLGGTIGLGANTLTLDQGTFGGAISGTGGLVKNGFGHLTLTGANTFTGGIVFNTGTLTLGAGSAGSAPANARADYLTLSGSTLNLLNGFTLAANQGVKLAGDVLLDTTGFVALNSDITGTGNLTLDSHGTTLFGGRVLTTGTLIVGNDSTIAIGRADSIDVSKTIFRNRTTLDIRGLDWAQNLNFTQGQIVGNVDGTVANSAATAVTLSSQITATNGFGLSGTGARLTFTGSIVSSVSPTTPLALYTNGEVALGTATAASLQNITVQSGALHAPVSAMTNLSTLKVESGGGLHLMGTPGTELTLSTLELKGNNSGLYNSAGGPVTFKTDLVLTSMDSAFRDTALIGGDYDLTFNGSISGQLSLLKVGTGNLFLSGRNESNQSAVTGWSNANDGARIGVREGTLTTNLGLLENRGLVIENSGQLVLTDAGNAALTLRNLGGNGTLTLGARGLTVNLVNTGTFTGTLTTSGLVTHNAANGLSGGSSGGTQTYGTINTLGLEVNVGDVIVTDALNTDYVTVNASGAAGSLTTTTRGLTASTDATRLDAQLQIQGTMRLSDGAAITGNAGSINLVGLTATLTDGTTTTSTLSHLTSNSGQISLNQGATVTGGAAATFTNTGVVSIGGANGATVSRWDGFNTINNSGHFAWSGYQLTGANSTNARFTSTGGTVQLLNGAAFTSTSGSALNNPAVTLTNTAFTTSGAAAITGGLALTGGSFTLGGAGTIGTLHVAGGVVFGGGTNFLWDINHAQGTDGVNRDLLAVTAMAGQADGKITFSGSAANPITFRANNPTLAALTNFDAAQPIEWVVATATEGFSGFSADQFIIDVSKLFTSYTGNFGLAVNGNTLVLKIFQSHVFDATSGNTIVSTPLAALGEFGGLNKSGAGTLTLATANNYTGVTMLTAGTLVLAADGALGTNRLTLNGGTLESTAARTVANGLNLSASSTIGGAANLTFTGSLISTSGSKTLAVTNTGTTTFGNIDFTSLLLNERLTFSTTGGTVNVAGTIVGSSASNTGITKTGPGTLVLSSANTYSGVTTLSGGTLVLAADGALGTSTLSLGAATTLRSDGAARTIANNVSLSGDATLGGTGNLTFTAPIILSGNPAAGRTLTITNTGVTTVGNIGTSLPGASGTLLTLAGSGSLIVNGTVANQGTGAGGPGNQALSLTKTGTGNLTLNGVNTYRGATTINGGSITVNGSALASAFTVNSGATIGGRGSIGALTLHSGATLAPGNSPGTLTTGSEIWNGGANYNWQIQNATGAAGVGYDLVNISGSLTINATSASRFNLNLFSIFAGDAAGNAINFNSALNSSYTIASATSIIGFDANAFTINASGFTNTLNGGSWNLSQVGNNLNLNFAAAAIPEPSTYAMIFGVLVLGLTVYSKRRL